jgi:hypothetical protein
MSERAAHRLLVLILVTFVVLGWAYACVTPTLEAPDEIHHYDYIRSLINTGRPPVLEEGSGKGFGHHAPLYYAAGALVSFWVGEDDLDAWRDRHNPFFGYGFGDVGRDNKNLYLHPDDDRFGASDTWLGFRVVRALSVLMGAVTLWAVYRTGREVYPGRPEMALGAAGLVAFIPQFLFISGAVNDDNGVALFGSLSLWAAVRILRRGATLRRCVGLGLVLGLGWLSKLNVIALVPAAVLAIALVARRSRSWRDLLRWSVVVLGVTGLLVVPWLVRQTVLYGDPTGTSREMSEWGLREEPVTLADLGPDLYWLRTSFWGRLGYNQVPLAEWIYVVLDGVTLLAVAGLVRLAVRRLRPAAGEPATFDLQPLSTTRSLQFITLAASFLLTFGPLIARRFLRPMPNFGRYLFPVLPAIALLAFAGLAAWLPRRRVSHLALGLTGAMLALGVAALIFFLAPAYARPPIYEAAAAPGPDHPLDWIYLEDGRPIARLLGYGLDRESVEPGETLHVTLYWEPLEGTARDYSLFVQLFGRGGGKAGQRDTYPGLGHYPTSFWQPGRVIVDEVPVPINPDAAGPSRLRLDVGLYLRGEGGRLEVIDEGGVPVGAATAGWLKLAPAAAAPPSVVEYRLGEGIALAGHRVEEVDGGIRLTLTWTCLAPPDRDYTVFVHLLDGAGRPASQADGPPVGGDYPTSYWAPGEVIVDERLVSTEGLAAGAYHLGAGMYLLETGERLAAAGAGGARLPNDVLPLAEVELP